MPSSPLRLASTSATRHALLSRLGLAFTSHDPGVDEPALISQSGLTAAQGKAQAVLLAQAKAQAVAADYPQDWVLGSDQVASLLPETGHKTDDQDMPVILHKPLSVARACEQLALCSGRVVQFDTAICLMQQSSGRSLTAAVPFVVQFRQLDAAAIRRYVEHDQPLWSAGSFKVEGLGMSLFASMQGGDMTALMGLPLMALCRLLRDAGFELP